jgi:hypothetical protein
MRKEASRTNRGRVERGGAVSGATGGGTDGSTTPVRATLMRPWNEEVVGAAPLAVAVAMMASLDGWQQLIRGIPLLGAGVPNRAPAGMPLSQASAGAAEQKVGALSISAAIRAARLRLRARLMTSPWPGSQHPACQRIPTIQGPTGVATDDDSAADHRP